MKENSMPFSFKRIAESTTMSNPPGLALPVSWKGTLIQCAGRLHRLHPNKTEVRIYDYVDRSVPISHACSKDACADIVRLDTALKISSQTCDVWLQWEQRNVDCIRTLDRASPNYLLKLDPDVLSSATLLPYLIDADFLEPCQ